MTTGEYNPIQGDIFAFLNEVVKPVNTAVHPENEEDHAAKPESKKQAASGGKMNLASEEMFPTLGSTIPAAAPTWTPQPAPVFQSNVISQTFELAAEQQKPLRSEARDKAPKSVAQICQEIASHTRTTIDASTSSKTRAMTFIIRGRPNDVAEAKRQLWSEVAQSMTSPVEVPLEHLGSVIGTSGKTLQTIMAETGTKINVARRSEEYPGYILVTGDYEGVSEAKSRIRAIVEEKQKKVVQKVECKAHLLPFVYGVRSAKINEQAQAWSEHYSIRISQDVNRETDEAVLTFSGDRDEVRIAVAEFTTRLEEQKKNVRSVSTAVPKALHKFLIGNKGSVLMDLETETGCTISIPGPDVASDQVTVIGPQDKLFKGLSAVMEKTSAVASETVKVPENVKMLVFERFRSNLTDLQNTKDVSIQRAPDGIQVNGFKDQVPPVVAEIQTLCRPLMAWKFDTSLTVDPKYVKHIIGKKGHNLQNIQSECGAYVMVPNEEEGMQALIIAGPSDAEIKAAKTKLNSLITTLSDFASADLRVEQKYHRALIGRAGSNLVKYTEQFPTVAIMFEDSQDLVVFKGRTAEVKAALALFKEEVESLKHDAVMHGYTVSLPFTPDQAKHAIREDGLARWIQGMARDFDIKVFIDAEKKHTVTLQGLKKSVEEAKPAILERVSQLERQGSLSFTVDHAYHSILIGKGGKNMKHLDKKYQVRVSFPAPEETENHTITVIGPKEHLEAAKNELVELYQDYIINGHTLEVTVAKTSVPKIIGRSSATIDELQEEFNCRINIRRDDSDVATVVIVGPESGIKKAAKKIKEINDAIEAQASVEIPLTADQLKKLLGEASGSYRALTGEYRKDVQFTLLGDKGKPGSVVLRGERTIVPVAEGKMRDFLAALDAYVTVKLDIPSAAHGEIIGKGGQNIRQLCQVHRVHINVPNSYDSDKLISVSGLPSDVEAASKIIRSYVREERHFPCASRPLREELKSELESSFPDVKVRFGRDGLVLSGPHTALDAALSAATGKLASFSKASIEVPKDKHRALIGPGGAVVRAIRESSGCLVTIPPAGSGSDSVLLEGTADSIAKAKIEIERIISA